MNFRFLRNSFLFVLTLLSGTIIYGQTTTFSYTGSAETYIIPSGVTVIKIEASGGQGGAGGPADGGHTGGLGATMTGTFEVTAGDTLDIIVGQAGSTYGNSGGGGAGSGVIFEDNPLIIAGGGGGAATNAAGKPGLITEDGGASSGAGGTGGNGGEKGYKPGDCGWAAGGGGFTGDGYGGTADWDGGALPGVLGGEGAGKSWANGGDGGVDGGCVFEPNAGSWGCGGGGAGSHGGAGGGGYSGGGGGQYVDPDLNNHSGGGGGSYNDGTDQVNTEGNNEGDGEIIITIVCESETITLTPTLTDETFGTDGAIDLEVTGENEPFTYDWDTDETGDFDDDQDLTDLVSGTYTVTVRDSIGCEKTESFTVNSQVSIVELDQDFAKLYPNPATDILTIEVPGNFSVALYAVNGEKIAAQSGQDVIQLSLDTVPSGTYILKVNSKDNTQSTKVIKR